MRENAQPATPTIADRQVPASSSHRTQAPVPPLFLSVAGDGPECAMFAANGVRFSGDAENVLTEDRGDVAIPEEVGAFPHAAAEAAAFCIFKIAGNGEPVLLEGTRTLDAAVAWVVSLRELFPGEYRIVDEATGKRIVFTRQSVLSDIEVEGDC